MEKKFLPAYILPRIVEGASRWYIVWYELNPVSGELERFRKTFQLNRIKKISERRGEARRLAARIARDLLGGGYVYPPGAVPAPAAVVSLDHALGAALTYKLRSARPNTANTYKSVVGIFRAWAADQRLLEGPLSALTKGRAIAFLDHCYQERGLGARSWNNYRTIMVSLFAWMVEREMISVNPWAAIKRQKPGGKQRREFTDKEKKEIFDFCRREKPGLALAILFVYYCFIRPNELRQLRRTDLDLEGGLVRIPAGVSKNRQAGSVTLPDVLKAELHTLKDLPDHFYLFGPDLQPNSRRPASKNSFNRQHREALEILQREGRLGNIEGLTFYSWKDTGLTDQAQESSLLDLMKQARHASTDTTLIYINRARPNEKAKKVKGKLL